MSFPFVSLRAYELVLSQLDIARKDMSKSSDRVDALIDTLTQLRRYGFDPERPTPVDITDHEPSDALPDEVQRVIDELALPGEPLYGDLARLAERELRDSSPEDVAQLIDAGADIEDL